MTEEMNPLRSFELDQDEWKTIVRQVRKEGREEWSSYAPFIIAAVEEGYFDEHLQMIALWLRSRYMALNDPAKPPAMAYATGIKPPGVPVVATSIPPDQMMPKEGIRPVGTAEAVSYDRTLFAARDYAFRKDDFVGKHFHSPVPVNKGATYKILKVNRENFRVEVVAVDDPAQRRHIGTERNFSIERQYRMYNIPRS